jgi:signal transduction histidine kinase
VVEVCGDADSVRLTVQDDGARAGQHEPVGFGLVGMTERAALLGGTLEAGPAAGQGWTVTAVLPRDGVPT